MNTLLWFSGIAAFLVLFIVLYFYIGTERAMDIDEEEAGILEREISEEEAPSPKTLKEEKTDHESYAR